MKKIIQKFGLVLLLFFVYSEIASQTLTYPIVDTNVHDFTSNNAVISEPKPEDNFYGQDANYNGNEPSYIDNRDLTITDKVTGLMWQKNMGSKISFNDAVILARNMSLGGHTDWRLPTIKELFSLVLYSGRVQGETVITKFINTDFFDQPIGDTSIGEREIDAQTWSSTHYEGLTMKGDSTLFGMNFVDGRIKGYPKYQPGSGNTIPKTMYFRMVRGNTAYGQNNFISNNDGTITDLATGLMWQQADDGKARDWQSALFYAENLSLAGYSDWRLPNVKELNSIVDYKRSPSETNSPAIDPLFSTSTINDPDGNPGHYPYFWTSTTLQDGPNPTVGAAYISFGKAYGKMNNVLMDTHGAGAVRSDPKIGSGTYPQYFGPQGDAVIVYNHARCVRTVGADLGLNGQNKVNNFCKIVPNPFVDKINIAFLENSENIKIEVLNYLGQTLKVINIMNTLSYELDLNHFSNGIYFIRISTKNNNIIEKIIKN
jgi:hypothetical protein